MVGTASACTPRRLVRAVLGGRASAAVWRGDGVRIESVVRMTPLNPCDLPVAADWGSHSGWFSSSGGVPPLGASRRAMRASVHA
jgi:hypothetical protein